jgi:hypothetical protein
MTMVAKDLDSFEIILFKWRSRMDLSMREQVATNVLETCLLSQGQCTIVEETVHMSRRHVYCHKDSAHNYRGDSTYVTETCLLSQGQAGRHNCHWDLLRKRERQWCWEY